jgi:hypothetical protein
VGITAAADAGQTGKIAEVVQGVIKELKHE